MVKENLGLSLLNFPAEDVAVTFLLISSQNYQVMQRDL